MSITPIFDKPEWTFKCTKEETIVAGMSGDVHVLNNKKERIYHTVPPSGFFTFAKYVLKASDLTHWQFYMDIINSRKGVVYIFGVENIEAEELYDLWKYTKSTLPLWYKP